MELGRLGGDLRNGKLVDLVDSGRNGIENAPLPPFSSLLNYLSWSGAYGNVGSELIHLHN